jgi:hypothetical protein
MGSSSRPDFQQPSYLQESEIKKELAAIHSEIAELDQELKKIQELRVLRVKDEDALFERLRQLKQARRVRTSGANGSANARGEIDYNADWEWSQEMQTKMKDVFGIISFRLCQKRSVLDVPRQVLSFITKIAPSLAFAMPTWMEQTSFA